MKRLIGNKMSKNIYTRLCGALPPRSEGTAFSKSWRKNEICTETGSPVCTNLVCMTLPYTNVVSHAEPWEEGGSTEKSYCTPVLEKISQQPLQSDEKLPWILPPHLKVFNSASAAATISPVITPLADKLLINSARSMWYSFYFWWEISAGEHVDGNLYF